MKKIILLFILLTLSTTVQGVAQEKNAKSLKILVLVIASDNLPVYQPLVALWRSYMHVDPRHVEAYFIRSDPMLSTNYEIKEDVIWCKTQEVQIPGIVNKTLLALESLMPRMGEFDFVVRTNLSSFYVFSRLLVFLETLPKENCYCGVINTHLAFPYASGAGFILSPDLVQLLVDHKDQLLNQDYQDDDVVIGKFLLDRGIQVLAAPREEFLSLSEWYNKKNHLRESDFHFRVKNVDPRLRVSDDIFIQNELIKLFY